MMSTAQPRFATSTYRTPEALKNPITNITNKGAETINVEVHPAGATSEEIAKITSDYIKRELLANEDFQKIFARKISPKLEVK